MKGYRGWYYDSYRHSLAAKGIKTNFVANSRKGNRSRPEDLVWDPLRKKYINWRQRAHALSIETGNKRKMLIGDTPDIVSPINIYRERFEPFKTLPVPEPIEPAIIPQVAEIPPPPPPMPQELPMSQAVQSIIPTPEMEIPPTEALPLEGEEQQAQPVEGRPSLEASAPPRVTEEPGVIVTSGVPQLPSPLAEEIREVRYEGD